MRARVAREVPGNEQKLSPELFARIIEIIK